MLRYLPIIISVAIQIYALVDCARTDQDQVRSLPKWGWLLIVIFIGVIGSVAWLVAGRPKKPGNGGRKKPRIIPPDDNPDFLKNL